ncbi:MAG: hypothetical protein AAGG08_03630 [Actinomycetota bacterium]
MLEPETLANIRACSWCTCDLDRVPRAYICDYHEGFDDGVAFLRQLRQAPAQHVERRCGQCGRPFVVTATNERKRYCCRACQVRAYRARPTR